MVKNELHLSTGTKEKNLLLIRLSAMGDVAMLVPVLSTFINQHPTVKITVLTREFFKPMFSKLPNVAVFNADVKGRHGGILGLWRLFRDLKKQKIDAVLDMHSVLRSKILGFWFMSSCIHFIQIDKGRTEKRALTASYKKVFKPLKSTHERYADVFRKLGYQLDLGNAKLLPKQPISNKIAETIKLGSKKKIVGIAPFAAYKGKTYPTHLMEQLIRELKNTKQYRILLFGGGAHEQQLLEKWAYQFNRCHCIAGKFSLEEELVIISNLDVMVAMDSGNGHLAAIYGVPVITLWGVTHPHAGFAAFGQDSENAILADRVQFPLIPTSIYGNKIPKGYEKAIATIDPKAVFLKIEAILNKK